LFISSIEEQALAYSDIKDGLIVYTMTEYPMKFFKHPNSLSMTLWSRLMMIAIQMELFTHFFHAPDPLVPWLYKSDYDTLLKTNKQQNGDLLDFITFINITELKERLMLQEESKPTTWFVPTNNSMSTILVEDGDMNGNVS
jgi:hypothetical protein